MSVKRVLCLLTVFIALHATLMAQTFTLGGVVIDDDTGSPVEFASVLLVESGQWAVTDEAGRFTVKNVQGGKQTLTVQCLGYQKRTMPFLLERDATALRLKLKPQSLKVDEVTVTARRKQDEATTSYTIDRTTLDQQQTLNLSDIQTLLPGGKTINATLMNDSRMALRSGSQEMGNASFGTAIEVDGVRLDNNAMTGETLGASTRTVSTSNVESIEVVSGIASVEYGDLSNGVVKVQTRRGKSPFIIEGKLNQHTRQIALHKGFDLHHGRGVLNVSLEHARSFSDAASPHTAYQRNVFSLNYMNIFWRERMPLTLNLSFSGNIGGYHAEADPDRTLDDYTKSRDNSWRGSMELNWQLNRPWLTNVQLRASLSYADKRSETYANQNSASAQPFIHSTDEGYFIATEYDDNPQAPIILGPTGYWYQLACHDSKPLSYALRLKASSVRRIATALNHLKVGAELTGSRNEGRGTYYDDLRTAPTWREYRYDRLPTMKNVALYIEDKAVIPTTHKASLELTAGVREDLTLISGSDYGTTGSLSPRVNARYVFWRRQYTRWVHELQLHAGWGKSVKLPSMQVLYPSPAYSDMLAFAPASTADNKAFYAYYTHPSQAVYNPDLRWQYTRQADLGIELDIKGTRLTLSAFHHKTFHPYMAANRYTPFAYKFTGQSHLAACTIPSAQRTYAIDRQTGIVSVSDQTGQQPATTLGYNERRTFLTNTQYTNASPVTRYGLEWIVDFAPIKPLRTQLRIDGNYYHYRGLDDQLFADVPVALSTTMSNGQPYGYIGYYRGSNATSTNYTANASVSNGALQEQLNLNATVTTHIPRLRMVVALRVETTLRHYRRALCELPDGVLRGIVADGDNSYFGEPYDGSSRDKTVLVYPEYYATWDEPDKRLPFAERLAWAYDNDRTLYNDLTKLVVRSNYPYTLNPNNLSQYLSANFSVTKEIGDHVSVSFYANNFFNNMRRVTSSQTGLETSLFESSYIPSYYYGLSLRLKI